MHGEVVGGGVQGVDQGCGAVEQPADRVGGRPALGLESRRRRRRPGRRRRTTAVAHRCTIPWWASRSRTVHAGQVGTGASGPADRAHTAIRSTAASRPARCSSTVGATSVMTAVCPNGALGATCLLTPCETCVNCRFAPQHGSAPRCNEGLRNSRRLSDNGPPSTCDGRAVRRRRPSRRGTRPMATVPNPGGPTPRSPACPTTAGDCPCPSTRPTTSRAATNASPSSGAPAPRRSTHPSSSSSPRWPPWGSCCTPGSSSTPATGATCCRGRWSSSPRRC